MLSGRVADFEIKNPEVNISPPAQTKVKIPKLIGQELKVIVR